MPTVLFIKNKSNSDDYSITLKGKYNSENFTFLKIEVLECKNLSLDHPSRWKPVCVNKDIVNK